MGMPQHSRTAPRSASDQTWTPARAFPAIGPRGDGRALTVLRVVTYVLASLTCLAVLAAVVWGAVVVQQLPALQSP